MNHELINLAISLKSFNKNFINRKNRVVALDNVFESKFLFLEHFLTKSEFSKSPYRNLLINYFKNAEKQFPGSSWDISEVISQKILGNYNKDKKSKTDNNIKNIFSFIKNMTDKETFILFKEILEFSGPDATILCKETKNSEISVEKSCMPSFRLSLKNEFVPIYFSSVNEVTKDVIFSVIDGYIERESELTLLIEKSKIEGLPVVVVCRGISYEATNHLKSILLRNNIKLYLYIEKFNDKDPYFFDDISCSAFTKTISGETLDSIYKDSAEKSSIVKVKLSPTEIKFYDTNQDLSKEINKQINFAKSNNIKSIDYLIKRKSRVLPNNVYVNIPKKEIRKILEIKNLIKIYNRIAAYGMFIDENNNVKSNFKHNVVDKLSESLYKNIVEIGYAIKLGETK